MHIRRGVYTRRSVLYVRPSLSQCCQSRQYNRTDIIMFYDCCTLVVVVVVGNGGGGVVACGGLAADNATEQIDVTITDFNLICCSFE